MEKRQWLLRNPVTMVLVPFLALVIGVSAWRIALEDPRALWLLGLPFAGLSMLLFGYLRLRAAEALQITYFPIWRRTIDWNDIRDAHVVKYEAWRYGGWGIRFSKGTVAYSVWSRDAIRFDAVGRRLAVVITTRRPMDWLAELEHRAPGSVRLPMAEAMVEDPPVNRG